MLTHLSLDNKAAVSQTIFFMHLREEKVLYFDWNVEKHVEFS